MLLTSKSFVFICVFLTKLVWVYGENVSLTSQEIDKIIKPKTVFNFTDRVMGGYRPEVHFLTKHLVSVRGGSPIKFFGDNHICGGTIITKKIVLTAAHCVVDGKGKKLYSQFLVVAGTPFLFESKTTMRSYKIIKEIVHPIFTFSTMRGDFALLISQTHFEEDGLSIQRIPIADSKPTAGMQCTSLGWGRIFPSGPRPDEALYVNLTLLRRLKCSEYYPMNPSVICASDVNDYEKGVWRGDSGGPLICEGKLTGVVSFGHTSGGPSYYASVYEHRLWILSSCANKLQLKFITFLLVIFGVVFKY